MGSPLLRAVAPRGGARTWLTRRPGAGLDAFCLAHRIEPSAVPAVEALRGLRHPHVGRTLGVATIDDAPHALAALYPAESLSRLRDRLARAGRPGLPLPVMIRVVAQIADGVAALHARGLCHGAVDARRVAVDYAGPARLLDAALTVPRGAAPADDINALGRLLTTLAADPPAPVRDLARRIGELDRAADVAAALDAWRRADPKCAAVDDARVTQWLTRVCRARWAVWRQAIDGGEPGSRVLDGLATLLGAPRDAPTLPPG